MKYCKDKMKLLDEIQNECKKMTNDTLKDVLYDIKQKRPIHIKTFVENFFNKFYPNDVFNNVEVRYAFEFKIRELCLKLKFSNGTFDKLMADSSYIDHWSGLYVKTKNGLKEDLDLWIHENDCFFDPCDLAWAIYNIYIGKVTFSE